MTDTETETIFANAKKLDKSNFIGTIPPRSSPNSAQIFRYLVESKGDKHLIQTIHTLRYCVEMPPSAP